jgi:hypothetical protein
MAEAAVVRSRPRRLDGPSLSEEDDDGRATAVLPPEPEHLRQPAGAGTKARERTRATTNGQKRRSETNNLIAH